MEGELKLSRSACCRAPIFIVDKSREMRYNELTYFVGVTGVFGKPVFVCEVNDSGFQRN